MSTVSIEGGTPLVGTVNLSGAKNSASKLIFASMFSNENVVLDNVPRIDSITSDIDVIKSIGGKAEWVGEKRLMLNGSSINSFEIPVGTKPPYRSSLLLAGPLIYRFGKSFLPKIHQGTFKPSPINRLMDTWKSLGIRVEEDEVQYKLYGEGIHPADINFRTTTHIGTDNAILSSIFLQGETTITNASEESEVDDLVEFCKVLGAGVERTEPRRIKIQGNPIFKGGSFVVQPDKTEAATFAFCALLTGGNIIIKEVNKVTLAPFVSFLTKVGAKFEFANKELRVWNNGEEYTPTQVTIAPAPGFLPDWQSLAVLLLNSAKGESLVHDTVYVNRFDYIKDLNRMGARIEAFKPSELGIVPVISDDSYDFKKQGEPQTIVKISGPIKLKGTKLYISDLRFGAVLVVAALSAEGKSEVMGYENVEKGFEGFSDKLKSLGAKIHI